VFFAVAFATLELLASAEAPLSPEAVAVAFPGGVATSASHTLPSVPVIGTSPEVDTHFAPPLAACALLPTDANIHTAAVVAIKTPLMVIVAFLPR
jgi:hypothetical protein